MKQAADNTSELEKLRVKLMERDEQLRDLEARRASEREEARLAIYHTSQEASNRLAEQETALGVAREEVKALRGRISETGVELTQIRTELTQTRAELARVRAELTRDRTKLHRMQQGAVEFTTQVRDLLNDYMRHLHREVHGPGSGVLSRLYPLKRSRLRKSVEELRGSTYFDAEWYLARNADVAKAGMDPALHFIEYGFQEGRAPSARFEVTR